MKPLLKATTLLEAPTGLALILAPAFVVHLLLGVEISGAALPLGRMAGVAVFALSTACWLAREGAESGPARAVVGAMAFYNFGAVIVLEPLAFTHPPLGSFCGRLSSSMR